MATMLGIDAKFYVNGGTFGSPTWTEVTEMRDVNRNDTWDEVEAPDRGSRIKSMAKTLRDISVTASMKKKLNNANVNTILTAMESGTGNVDIMVLDGDDATNGARGIRYEAIVSQANESQAISDPLYLDLKFSPDAFSANNFQSVLVTAGSPVFTNL